MKKLIIVSILLSLAGTCVASTSNVSVGEDRVISFASDPNYTVSANAKPALNFGGGYSPYTEWSYFAQIEKNFGAHARGMVGYTGFIESQVLDAYGVKITSRLYWDEKQRYGVKGRFGIEHYNFESGLDVQVVLANILAGRRIGKGVAFVGVKGPLMVRKSSSDYEIFGEVLTSRLYAGAEYPLFKVVNVYADYFGGDFSLGVMLKYPAPDVAIKYRARDNSIIAGHPFYSY